MEKHILAYFIGIFIVFASHAHMLFSPGQKAMSMENHSYANLFAAALIAYYFSFTEKYISF